MQNDNNNKQKVRALHGHKQTRESAKVRLHTPLNELSRKDKHFFSRDSNKRTLDTMTQSMRYMRMKDKDLRWRQCKWELERKDALTPHADILKDKVHSWLVL